MLPILLFPFLAWTPPEYAVYRTTSPVRIDGRLDEAAWFAAPAASPMHFPWYKTGAKEQTIVKMLWDDENLYVGHISLDSHITARDRQHDGKVAEDDCFEIMIMPDPDQPDKYFNIEWNVLGGYVDNHRPNGPARPRAPQWDAEGIRIAGTYVGTLNDDSNIDQSWTVEVAIPLRNFTGFAKKIPPAPGTVWRGNFNRHGGLFDMQYSQWSPADTEKPAFHTPHRFGRFVFSAESRP